MNFQLLCLLIEKTQHTLLSFPLMQKTLDTITNMWSNLPFDLLANIFSYLAPDSLARAKATCQNWHRCAKSTVGVTVTRRHPPWLIALPMRSVGASCYAHSPIANKWHALPFDYIATSFRPVASIGGIILLRVSTRAGLQLAICNPFTRQFRYLPMLNVARTNPAIGVVEDTETTCRYPSFKIYVAGGMLNAPSGGGLYQPTLEMYDSCADLWSMIGPIPMELAVRLTVWTPNESVYSNGTIYWMTSARAYSIMGFEIATNKWIELSVPMADSLEFAALAPRNGKLSVVGGACESDAFVWELGGGGEWSMVGKVPVELRVRLFGDKESWSGVKCVGIDEAVCLFKDLESGIVVWREVVGEGKWEWSWIEGCCSIKGKQIRNFPIKGLLIHPNLVLSSVFDIDI